jgi:hypothetical protein
MLLSYCGCAEEAPGQHSHDEAFELNLCGQCGNVKEDGHVCKEGATKCPNCGLHKGSILCCTYAAARGPREVIMCTKCGEVGFTRRCCKEGTPLCPKCGFHKDSPGCCKVDRFVKGPNGEAEKAWSPPEKPAKGGEAG